MKAKFDEYEDGTYYVRFQTSKSDFMKLLRDFLEYESVEDLIKLKRKVDNKCKELGLIK